MDSYVANPELLAGTPKRTLAELARKEGLRVPVIYDSISEALRSSKPLILRSENWREYAGASGMLDSYPLDAQALSVGHAIAKKRGLDLRTLSIESILDQQPHEHWWLLVTRLAHLSQNQIAADLIALVMRRKDTQMYCKLAGIDPMLFANETSFVAWERLPGVNCFVVADSAVAGRYHLLMKRRGYVVLENSTLRIPADAEATQERTSMTDTLLRIPDWYERVRRLPGTDPNHCPLIELQIADGDLWFLQYHRTRDFAPATHALTRLATNDEITTTLVRGKTGPEGMDVRMTQGPRWDALWDTELSKSHHVAPAVAELMSRKLKVQTLEGSAGSIASRLLGHYEFSRLFNPEVTLGVEESDWDRLIPENDRERTSCMFHVVADGTTAYLRRATELEE